MKTNPFLVAVTSAAMLCASVVAAAAQTAPVPDTAAAPDQVVYAPRLPTVQELTDTAAARGATVERVEETAGQITATYRQPDGQLRTVAYALLPTASPAGSTTVITTPPPPVVVAPSTTVIYRPARRVVYYDPWVYDPWYRYPSVAVGIGFGLGHYHGHHAHFRHHYRHGGFHRRH